MGETGPTDVLAFPMDDLRPTDGRGAPRDRAARRRRPLPVDRRRRRRGTPVTTPRPSCGCSALTASCTCSGTTTTSRTRSARCSACRRGCWLVVGGRASMTGDGHLAAGRRRGAGRGGRCALGGRRRDQPGLAGERRGLRACRAARRRGAATVVLADPARYVNVALFLRAVARITAVVLVTRRRARRLRRAAGRRCWSPRRVMVVVDYVVVGVAPADAGSSARRANRAGHRAGRLPARDGARTAHQGADPARQRTDAWARASATGRSPARPSCATWSTSPRSGR